MEILLLNDGTEIVIEEGSTLNTLIFLVDSYFELETLANKLSDTNLSDVKLIKNGEVRGQYYKMALKTPYFSVTKLTNDKIKIVFGLRNKTEQELQEEEIQEAITYLNDEQALNVQNLYPEWKAKGTYYIGDRRRHKGVLYKCLADHEGQPDWSPDVSPSLWTRILIEDPNDIPDWIQPDSTNAYMTGDKVKHNNKIWTSNIDNNVWEPGVYGWTEE